MSTDPQPTALEAREKAIREHTLSLHLMGERLSQIESWFWSHLADVREAARQELGGPLPDDVVPAVAQSAPAETAPPTDLTAEEAYRLALSNALRLGTGANWEAIRDRAEDLTAEVAELAEARATNRRLNLRAQKLESELATYRRAVGQWEVSKRGTYVPLRTIAAIAKAAGRDIETPQWLLHYQRVEQAEAAIERVRRLHDSLEQETDLSEPDDLITKGSAARRIATALDGWSPALLPYCDVEFEGGGTCTKAAGHWTPQNQDPHTPPAAGAQQPKDRLLCPGPNCGEDITDYDEDDHVFRTGDDRPYCSGECVIAAHRKNLPTTPAKPVRHAPGIATRCADCRAKGHTVCMDDVASQPKEARP